MCVVCCVLCFFFQAEDGIRDLVRSRGLGDVYKRQGLRWLGNQVGALHCQRRLRLGCAIAATANVLPDLSLIHI